MKWIPQEVETYLNAKEYVDTALVPLYFVSTGAEMKQSAEAAEFITLLSSHLERQFTGRIVLFPPFTYLINDDNEKVLNDLKNWENTILKAEFKHLFYLTSDINWRTKEDKVSGSIIWVPSIPLEQMNDSQKLKMIDSQTKQLLALFTNKWNEKR